MARPLTYSDEILTKTKAYIDSCEDVEDQVISGESEKFTSYKTKLRVKLPTIEGLAYHLGVHKDTVYDWRKKYVEFSDLINILLGKQAQALINNGLSGDYNPMIAKVLLTKHGYSDKQEIDQNTKHSGEIAVKWEEPNIPDQSDQSSA